MKVTVCFDETKVRVPCGTGEITVAEIINNAISRYKKAMQKSMDSIIKVYKLQTKRDGGILDPDDILKDVVEDEEMLIAIYDEEIYNTDRRYYENDIYNKNWQHDEFDKNNKIRNIIDDNNDALSSNDSSNDTAYDVKDDVDDNDKFINRGTMARTSKMKNDIESCINNRFDNEQINFVNCNIPHLENNETKEKLIHINNKNLNKDESIFNRGNINRQSKAKNEGFSQQNKHLLRYEYSENKNLYNNNNNDVTKFIFKLTNIQGPLGIHVIPTFDFTSQKDMGLIIQQIEPNGRIYEDGRLKIGDRIIEVNDSSLLGVDFLSSQEILRDAMKSNHLILTIIRENKNGLTYESEQNMESNDFYHQSSNTKRLFDQKYSEIDDDYKKEIEIEIIQENEIDNLDLYSKKELNGRNNDMHLKENLNSPNILNKEDFYMTDTKISPSYLQNGQLFANKTNLNSLNTKKIGKKIHIQLMKGPQGLGFKLAARDNPTGEISPIYIKNILPKGAAIIDGRLQRGDRLLEVNGTDMTTKTLHEAVNILRNTKLGSLVDIVVSRQLNAFPRELTSNDNNINQIIDTNISMYRELLTFEIPLNDTGSAGLGVSVKGKTKKVDDVNIDLGIFVKTVINGGAASKDGRLKPNDQLININGFSLLGKSNEEAMQILREAMQVETTPGYIELTISRKRKQNITTNNDCNNEMQILSEKEQPNGLITSVHEYNKKEINPNENSLKINNKNIPSSNENDKTQNTLINLFERNSIKNDKKTNSESNTEVFNCNQDKRAFARDAPTRRSMSEKRKQTSDLYSKIKINKTTDKEKTHYDLVRVGSFESLVNKKLTTTKSNEKNDNIVASKEDEITQDNQKFTNPNKQNPTNLKNPYNTIDNHKPTSQNISQPHTNNNLSYLVNNKKSSSMESIPMSVEVNNDLISKKIKDDKMKDNFNKYVTNWESCKTNNINNIDSNYPLSNILNRQRTVNRSFRTAVDKSFDIPSSDASDEGIGHFGSDNQRMNCLRMSSQSDDLRKNKKTKKSIIEAFQNFFKTNKKLNQEQKYPVELLTYQKNNDFTRIHHSDDLNNKDSTDNEKVYLKENSKFVQNNNTTVQNQNKNGL